MGEKSHEEIVTALDVCAHHRLGKCRKCPYREMSLADCMERLMTDARTHILEMSEAIHRLEDIQGDMERVLEDTRQRLAWATEPDDRNPYDGRL